MYLNHAEGNTKHLGRDMTLPESKESLCSYYGAGALQESLIQAPSSLAYRLHLKLLDVYILFLTSMHYSTI